MPKKTPETTTQLQGFINLFETSENHLEDIKRQASVVFKLPATSKTDTALMGRAKTLCAALQKLEQQGQQFFIAYEGDPKHARIVMLWKKITEYKSQNHQEKHCIRQIRIQYATLKLQAVITELTKELAEGPKTPEHYQKLKACYSDCLQSLNQIYSADCDSKEVETLKTSARTLYERVNQLAAQLISDHIDHQAEILKQLRQMFSAPIFDFTLSPDVSVADRLAAIAGAEQTLQAIANEPDLDIEISGALYNARCQLEILKELTTPKPQFDAFKAAQQHTLVNLNTYLIADLEALFTTTSLPLYSIELESSPLFSGEYRAMRSALLEQAQLQIHTLKLNMFLESNRQLISKILEQLHDTTTPITVDAEQFKQHIQSMQPIFSMDTIPTTLQEPIAQAHTDIQNISQIITHQERLNTYQQRYTELKQNISADLDSKNLTHHIHTAQQLQGLIEPLGDVALLFEPLSRPVTLILEDLHKKQLQQYKANLIHFIQQAQNLQALWVNQITNASETFDIQALPELPPAPVSVDLPADIQELLRQAEGLAFSMQVVKDHRVSFNHCKYKLLHVQTQLRIEETNPESLTKINELTKYCQTLQVSAETLPNLPELTRALQTVVASQLQQIQAIRHLRYTTAIQKLYRMMQDSLGQAEAPHYADLEDDVTADFSTESSPFDLTSFLETLAEIKVFSAADVTADYLTPLQTMLDILPCWTELEAHKKFLFKFKQQLDAQNWSKIAENPALLQELDPQIQILAAYPATVIPPLCNHPWVKKILDKNQAMQQHYQQLSTMVTTLNQCHRACKQQLSSIFRELLRYSSYTWTIPSLPVIDASIRPYFKSMRARLKQKIGTLQSVQDVWHDVEAYKNQLYQVKQQVEQATLADPLDDIKLNNGFDIEMTNSSATARKFFSTLENKLAIQEQKVLLSLYLHLDLHGFLLEVSPLLRNPEQFSATISGYLRTLQRQDFSKQAGEQFLKALQFYLQHPEVTAVTRYQQFKDGLIAFINAVVFLFSLGCFSDALNNSQRKLTLARASLFHEIQESSRSATTENNILTFSFQP